MPRAVTETPLFEIGRQLCAAVGIDQDQAARLTDAERLAVAREIARLASIGAQQVSAGKLGAAMAHGSPGQRKAKVDAMQRHADQLHARHPDWSWREIARHVGKLFDISGRAVRGKCKNPKKAGTGAYASRPPAGEIESPNTNPEEQAP